MTTTASTRYPDLILRVREHEGAPWTERARFPTFELAELALAELLVGTGALFAAGVWEGDELVAYKREMAIDRGLPGASNARQWVSQQAEREARVTAHYQRRERWRPQRRSRSPQTEGTGR